MFLFIPIAQHRFIIKTMSSKKSFILILVLFLIAIQAFGASNEVSINYVSSTLNLFTSASGSNGGGTVLYISGSNFSPIADDIQIYFANYPCILIAAGSTVNMLSCTTTPLTDPTVSSSLSVTIYTKNLLPVTCSSFVCKFSYNSGITPFISEVFPATVGGNQMILINGVHRTINVGDGRSPSASDLTYILIGDTSCSTLDVAQNISTASNSDNLYCNTFMYQEAGEYNMSERVIYGDALFSVRSIKTSFFSGLGYVLRIAPKFDTNTIKSGGAFGHLLTFTGSGFSSNPINLTSFTCTLGAITCSVISNPQGSIQVQLPPYQAGYETSGKLPLDLFDNSTQQSPFVGSFGFRYTRYAKSSKTLDLLIKDLRIGNSTSAVIYDGYRTQLGTLRDGWSMSYDDYMRGYFYAPVDGSYLFQSIVDDSLVVFMSKVQNNSNPNNMVILMRVDTYFSRPEDPYNVAAPANVATVTLKRGYYYMEIIARGLTGPNYYYVSVSMPQFKNNTVVSNPTWMVKNINIAPSSVLPEIITITVDNSKFDKNTTSFTLYYYVASGSTYNKVSSSAIKLGCTAAQFQSAIGGLGQFSWSSPTITLTMLTSNGNVTTVNTTAVKYVYQLSYKLTRPATYATLPYSSFAAGVNATTTQPHSPGISGTYMMIIDGVPLSVYDSTLRVYSTSIQLTNSLGHLQTALQLYHNSTELLVISRNMVQMPDQLDFNILYFGVPSPSPFTIQTAALIGGTNDKVVATVTILRDYDPTRPYYISIPYEFLRMAVQSPTIVITYNKIPAICIDCFYVYQSTSPISVSAAAFKSNNIGLDISLTTNSTNTSIFTSFSLTDVTVTLYGQPCILDANSTTTRLFCSFNTIKSSNGSVIANIPAGNEPPQVHIRQLGFISSKIAILRAIVVSSVSPVSLGSSGGVTVSIVGSYFPLTNTGWPQLQIVPSNSNFNGSVVSPSLVSNLLIQFNFPALPASLGIILTTFDIKLVYSGYTQSFTNPGTLTLDPSLDPTVTSLSYQSASPILKQNLVITGANFDANASNMRVYLYFATNNTLKYELGIYTVANKSSLTCVLGGGRTGDYYIRVLVVGKGMSAPSPASKFSYEIVVTSVFPTVGSIGGGYSMTITGYNFATASGSTQAFIGDGLNSICTITSITSTTITCKVPPINDAYLPGDVQRVVVTGRLVEESRCGGNCTFAYTTNGTVFLNLLSNTTFKNGDLVTITTNNAFIVNSTIVTVNSQSVVITSITNTSLSFAYPALPAGTYPLVVIVNGVNAYPIIQTTTLLIFTSASATTGSNKGQAISVIGNGFSSIKDPKNIIYYNCSAVAVILPILSMTSKNVTFQVPPGPNATCQVNVTMGLSFYVFNYVQNAGRTPMISVTTLANSKFVISVTNSNSKSILFIVGRYIDSDGGLTSSIYPFNWTANGTNQYLATPAGSYLPAGTFSLDVAFTSIGYADSANNKVTIAPTALSALTPTNATASFGGQGTYTLTSAGFITNDIKNNQITVCGIRASIISADQIALTFQIPAFINAYTNNKYGLGVEQVLTGWANIISDTVVKTNYAFDNNTKSFYSSNSSTCYLGLDFGVGAQAMITKIRYMPNAAWIRMDNYFDGAVFEGSNNNINWTTIFTIDPQLVRTGWNVWLDSTGTNIYQYIRFRQTNGKSNCQLAELQISGIVYSTTAYSATLPCPVSVNFFGTSQTYANAITYSDAATSVITSISPPFGPSTGGILLTITGSNFATSSISVVIDGITCSILLVNATQIKCTTGKRVTPPPAGNSFVVTSNGYTAILDCDPFLYMDRWSSPATWGGEVPPREGDTVYVPPGMTLLVDQSTPFVNAIIVEGGKIIFSDEIDMTVDANYFILIGGQFRAGLPSATYQHKLTITLHGGYYDKQLPYFGNKVLGCMNCIFNMHGAIRIPTWSQITATVVPGDNKLTLLDAVDWKVGESIAIAATGYNHYESEDRVIVAVSSDKKTLTIDKPFVYRHFAGTENYGGKDFVMNAEVGLLTRNIVIQGDNMTDIYNHGSHLIFMGKVANGLDATLSYTEIRNCGQPKIIARYCSHFHLAGEVPNSFVRGIAVHHSKARVLTIHGTHYLTVEKNVGYLVQGHNIFIEDGIETYNIIQNNLMISTIASLTMLQSDTSPASYWITNPLNTVINNHAAGGDFYGFWYQIKPNPDGPSATPNICPTGMRLGLSSNNVAHSNRRFGLRIFNYAARQYPCLPLVDETLVNPWDFNPAFQSVFDNYLLWKNQENGVLGQQLGFVTLSNFLIIDSGASGMEFYVANVSLQNVTAKQSVIVGYSAGNAPTDMAVLNNVRGIITPRTDGFRGDDITFANFGAKMTPLKSCSKCENLLFQVTGGKTSFFNNIKYSNIQGNYIYWNNWRRQIFIDQDGTLTRPITAALNLTNGTYGTITPYFDHLNIPGKCYNIINKWDNSSFCDQTITIRSILYTNADPYNDMAGQTARTFRLNQLNDSDTPLTYEIQPMIVIKKSRDVPFSWAYPYAVGYSYHTHFQLGIDFLHLSLGPSMYWLNNEAIVIKFNYTDQRQSYKVGHYFSKKLQTPLISPSNTLIDPATCQNGDYYHDPSSRHLYVCVSGRNKTIREWIDITGVRCSSFCPTSDPTADREAFTRKWSNTTQWPNGTLPKAGDNVTIPYTWNIIMDLSPPALNYLLVNGLLYFDMKDLTLQANYIWVQQGGIYIGSQTEPYTYQAKIILNGNKDDNFLVLDPSSSGNKMLAVTGALEFYGKPPSVTWTRLTAIAPANTSTITVDSLTDWKVGDEIVIGATYSGQTEDEVFKIAAISGNTVSLNGTLAYEHYGDTSPLTNSKNGTIDMRAAVGLLTRNIKVTRGSDPNNWGCRIQVYSYLMQFTDPKKAPVPVNGYVFFNGVELDGCGQYGSSNAGLRIQKLGSMVSTAKATVISNSTIRNCNGYCTYIDNSANVTFDNNVFHSAVRYTVYVLKVRNYAFINNVLLGLQYDAIVVAQNAGTGLAPNNAAYKQFVPVNSDTDNITVTRNLVQGSQDLGFVFSFTPCTKLSTYPFYGNTAGSCFAAFAINVYPGTKCIGAAGFSGYASYIGFIANPPGVVNEVQYSDMFFVDNQRGFTLRYAHEIDDNTMKLSNSYFMGYSRPSCPSCYSSSKLSYCNDGYAIRMFTATLSGEHFPYNKNISHFDVICTQQAFDAKAFLTNVTFQNYIYGNNSAVPYCTNMNVFRKHDLASDATAAHNLYNTTCVNCDLPALVYFSPPSPSWSGWAGGCGELPCTGSINYYIHDHDGYFTQSLNNNTLQPTQLLANNQPIGGNETACQKIDAWNGYWCKFEQLAILQYQSIAADYNKRMVWPVYLNYDGGMWNSTTNGWKEWNWIAPGDPANTRLARFWSVLRVNKQYNMTYSSQPPTDAVYQIQKRQLPTGNPKDWVIIRIYFPVPNVVIVRVTNTTKTNLIVPSYQQVNGTYKDLKTVTGICGANYYQFEKNVIHFVVNGINNCQVRLTLSSYVQLTVRFQTDMSTFYSNDGQTSVLTNIMAFLNIDPSQIKLVGINPGSVICKFIFYPKSINKAVSVNTNSTQSTNGYFVAPPAEPAKDSNQLNGLSNKIMTAINSDQLDLGYNVLSVNSTVNVYSTNSSAVTVCPVTYLYNQTTKACYCDSGYVQINQTCIACVTLDNTQNTTSNITGTCVCIPTLTWLNTSKKCGCPGPEYIIDNNNNCFKCSNVSNSTGLVDNTTANACKCKPSFQFINNTCVCPDPQSFVANNTCFGCSNVSLGTGKVANNSKGCACIPPFVYNPISKKCECLNSSLYVYQNTSCVKCLDNRTCNCSSGMIFKISLMDCGCPYDNSSYSGGVCTSCNSSYMTGAVNGTQCVCLPTFVWSKDLKTCICPSSEYIVASNNTCFKCSNVKNSTGLADNTTANACKCKPSFQFINNTCVCPDPQSFVANNTCFGCSNVSLGTGKVANNSKGCACIPPFVYNPISKKCECLNSSLYVYQNTSCVKCLDNRTCNCSSGMIFKISLMDCGCPYDNSSYSGGVCTSCNSSYMTGAVNGTQCVCLPTFVWSKDLKTCICPSSEYIVASNNTCFKCSNVKNSTGLADNTTANACKCKPSFQFINNTCVCPDPQSFVANNTCFGCSNVSLGTGKVANNSKGCACIPPFVYNPISKKCECLNSSLYVYQNTSCVKCLDNRTCNCSSGMIFKISLMDCGCPYDNSSYSGGVCTSCNSSYMTGAVNGTQCVCLPTFVWSKDLKTCICPSSEYIVASNNTCFKCSNVKNSTGLADNTTANACKCKPSFQFINNTCVCPDPQSFVANNTCFGCSNVSLGTGKVANNSKGCACIPPFVYNPISKKCECLNSSLYVYQNTSCVKCLDNRTCNCSSGMIFKISLMDCGCPYDNSSYSGGVCTSCNSSYMTGAVNGTQCVCLPTFVWSNLTCKCIGSQSIIVNNACVSCNGTGFNFSGKGVVAGANKCICKDTSFIWSASLGRCICDVNFIFINNTCISCSKFANTVFSNSSNQSTCICLATMTFDKSLSCICIANNSIVRQGTCVDCASSTINGVAKSNSVTCSCSATLNLIWDNITQTCICKSNTFKNGNGCQSCKNLTYSTGVGVEGLSCVCKDTFTWNPNVLSCTCNSSTVLGLVISGTQKCLACDVFIGASGVNSIDNTQCACLGGLTWDSFKKLCVCATNSTNSSSIIMPDGTCIVCSTSTDPNIVNPPVDIYNCKCANPYFWDNLKMKCIKCTDLPNGLSKTTGNQLICKCKTGYSFDPYTNQCLINPSKACVAANISSCLNCTLIPFADIITGPVAQTAGKYLAGKDTTVITKQYTSLSKTYNSYQCLCTGAYLWEPTRRRCQSIFR